MDYDGPLSEQNPEVIFGKASDPFTMLFKITNQIYGPYRPNWPLRVFKLVNCAYPNTFTLCIVRNKRYCMLVL